MAKYQHEPVIPPAQWGFEEKRFAYSIDKLFDQVFAKLGEYQARIAALENPAEEEEEEE